MGKNQSIITTGQRGKVLKTFAVENIGNLIKDIAYLEYMEKYEKTTRLFRPLTDSFTSPYFNLTYL